MFNYTENTDHLQHLKSRGFNPKLVIDVGVSNGEFFYECQKIFNNAEYLLFEAREKEETLIEKVLPHVGVKVKTFYNTLLGAGHDEVDFHQLDAGSSIYPEDTKFPKQIVKKHMSPLDNYLINEFYQKDSFPMPAFLKIDTQGAELEILTGTQLHLDFIEVIQLEVALQEYNIGAPGAFEVHEFMNKKGFKLYDIGTAFRRESDQALFHVDWIFAAERSKLWDKNYYWGAELKYV
jgi:FkbM family methyltransferase